MNYQHAKRYYKDEYTHGHMAFKTYIVSMTNMPKEHVYIHLHKIYE